MRKFCNTLDYRIIRLLVAAHPFNFSVVLLRWIHPWWTAARIVSSTVPITVVIPPTLMTLNFYNYEQCNRNPQCFHFFCYLNEKASPFAHSFLVSLLNSVQNIYSTDRYSLKKKFVRSAHYSISLAVVLKEKWRSRRREKIALRRSTEAVSTTISYIRKSLLTHT